MRCADSECVDDTAGRCMIERAELKFLLAYSYVRMTPSYALLLLSDALVCLSFY